MAHKDLSKTGGPDTKPPEVKSPDGARPVDLQKEPAVHTPDDLKQGQMGEVATPEQQQFSAAEQGIPMEADSDEETLDANRPYSMVYHEGGKHYTQDGKLYDRATKRRIAEKADAPAKSSE